MRVFHACIKDLHEHFRTLLINSKEVSDVQRIKNYIHKQLCLISVKKEFISKSGAD